MHWRRSTCFPASGPRTSGVTWYVTFNACVFSVPLSASHVLLVPPLSSVLPRHNNVTYAVTCDTLHVAQVVKTGLTGAPGIGGLAPEEDELMKKWRERLQTGSLGHAKRRKVTSRINAMGGGAASFSSSSCAPPEADVFAGARGDNCGGGGGTGENSEILPGEDKITISGGGAGASATATVTADGQVNVVAALMKIVPHLNNNNKKFVKAAGLVTQLLDRYHKDIDLVDWVAP